MKKLTSFYRQAALLAVVSASLFFNNAVLHAASVGFSTNSVDASGTGFGAIFNVLTVQNDDTEWGSVLLDGSGLDVLGGNATASSMTRTADELLGSGIDRFNFGLVLNINESVGPPPREITLNDFTVRFYTDPNNFGSFFDATYVAPVSGVVLPAVAPGTGTAGWLFNIQLSEAEFNSFFGNPLNRVGMFILEPDMILNSSDGAENFFFVAIPEPSTYAFAGLGAVVALFALRRRK